MFGFIEEFNPETGGGVITAAGMQAESLPFLVAPGTKFEIGQRVEFSIGRRAVDIRLDVEAKPISIKGWSSS
jgi:hypothetical protein